MMLSVLDFCKRAMDSEIPERIHSENRREVGRNIGSCAARVYVAVFNEKQREFANCNPDNANSE